MAKRNNHKTDALLISCIHTALMNYAAIIFNFFVLTDCRFSTFTLEMKNQGLLFIPDISGFTKFVTETEIEHSRLIIQELLEILINANNLGLEISEIEGDAILFYKFGNPPELKELYRQVEKMFVEFHRSIIAYEHRRYCQCTACRSTINLTLKVITHYGEFTGYNVKNFSKLIGKDIIVAHQLLKNDIQEHEYWLVTRNLLADEKPLDFATWMKWNRSTKLTESGEVSFQYTQLSQLRNEIPPESPRQTDLKNMSKMFSVEREYNTDIITLFHATGDFRYRYRWQVGVKAVEELNHFLPRVGMKCRCILDDGEVTIYSNDYYYQDSKIEFSEMEENKNSCTRYTLEKTGVKRTRLTLEFYLKKNPFTQLMFKFTKKKNLANTFRESVKNLDNLIQELRIPSALDS